MPQTVEQRWSDAERRENCGDRSGARAQYEALLAMDAGFVPAHLRLSRHAQWEGRYRAARQHALDAADALRLGTSSVRYLAYVAQRLLDFADTAEAAALILSADWTSQAVLQQSPSLSQCLWLAGRYDDALRLLDEVEPRLAPNALLFLTRGNVSRYLGQMEDAERSYVRSLELEPDLSDAHWALATLSSREPPPRWLRGLQSARAKASSADPVVHRAQLAYAAFHAFDRVGHVDVAWAALSEGLELMRPQARYEASRLSARLESLMSAEPIRSSNHAASTQPAPVFIVGLPRTGTTLLDRLLGNHGWVTSVGERNDLAAAASEVLDRFFTTEADSPERIEWSAADAARVGHSYRQRLRAHAPATAFAIDKNPRNLFNLPLILAALPDAKVLILQRDPMDAAFSNLKELFQGGAYPYSYDFADVATHLHLAERWSRHWAEVAPNAVRLVSYEALVRQTRSELDGLLAFIGLPADPALDSLERNASPVSTASSAQVRGPIHERGIGAWRRYAAQLEPLRLLIGNRGSSNQ